MRKTDFVQQEIDRLYRSGYGKMIGALLYFSRDIDLETAEDLVQDSFSAALTAWRGNSIPDNPEAWLFRVCKNKALDRITEIRRLRGLNRMPVVGDPELAPEPSPDRLLEDSQLNLLFLCANPDLPPKTQVVITLKYVAGIKVEALAQIFGMTIDGVDKLLLRARQKIKQEKILLAEPATADLYSRVAIVHKIIYLIFNEGYKSSWGKDLVREELCEEALLLNRALLNSPLGNAETKALYALMLFNAARFKARFGSSGELLDLEEQDRSLWSRDLIDLGCHFFRQSRSEQLSQYHFEAAIAQLHCLADHFNKTDWIKIAALYEQLLKRTLNPFVELNYAIAMYYAAKRETAWETLNKLRQSSFMSRYYLLYATLGKICFLEKNYDAASAHFKIALEQTGSPVEKDFIMKMIVRIEKAADRTGHSDASPKPYR
ncbi:MAG TPA: sigma-70 family RNA polymerase sigma factor [Puia sp.]|nr:sigma-70 family RNA polymerase sigma factor [Puia sp.]